MASLNRAVDYEKKVNYEEIKAKIVAVDDKFIIELRLRLEVETSPTATFAALSL